MNNGNIKTLAMIAMILQVIAVAGGFVIVVMQKLLVSAFMVRMSDAMKPVVPVTLFFMILQLIIYIIFYRISQNEGNKPQVIMLIVVSVFFSILSVVGNMAGSYFYSRMGAEAIATYSSVTTLVSYANLLFGIPAAPLFYIACGQYTGR